jgi:hypothetical protein
VCYFRIYISYQKFLLGRFSSDVTQLGVGYVTFSDLVADGIGLACVNLAISFVLMSFWNPKGL